MTPRAVMSGLGNTATMLTSAPPGLNISVALCTYNGERFLEEQLESILGQSVLPREIVISDDGSTDGTLAVLARVLTPRRLDELGIQLTVLRREKPLGVTKNFGAALAECSGDFVSLCDQDDVWRANRLERLVAGFSSPEVMLVHSDARMIDAAGNPLRHSLLATLGVRSRERRAEQGPKAFEVLLRRNLVTGATAMVRRSLITASQPFPKSWVHDHWLAVMAAIAGRIVLCPETLIDYRQHETNQIGAVKLTPSVAVGILGRSRRVRHEARVNRMEELTKRLDTSRVRATDGQKRFAAQKLTHERVRLALPDRRPARWRLVAREFVSGKYHRLSRGFVDVARDALSPS